MPTNECPGLWFEVDPDRDPIAGHMHVSGEPTRPFHSWLELVALIEQTRATRSDSETETHNQEER